MSRTLIRFAGPFSKNGFLEIVDKGLRKWLLPDNGERRVEDTNLSQKWWVRTCALEVALVRGELV